MTTPDNLRYVEGELNYLVPMPERPRYYAYDAGPEAPTNMAHEAHTVRIHDLRPIHRKLHSTVRALLWSSSAPRCATSGTKTKCTRSISPRLSVSSPR